MSFLNSPIVICGSIALGIVLILVIAVIICCKRSSEKEREELRTLSEEIEANNLENSVSSEFDDKIENVLSKMQEALDLKEENSVSFEEEQEENAIISYQELLNSLGVKSSIDVDSIEVFDDELENVEISDFNKEIIEAYQRESVDREIYRFQNDYSSQEMPMEFSSDETPVMNLSEDVLEIQNNINDDVILENQDNAQLSDAVYEARHVVGRFKKSEIISPVYGIVPEKKTTPIDDIEEIIFDDDSL